MNNLILLHFICLFLKYRDIVRAWTNAIFYIKIESSEWLNLDQGQTYKSFSGRLLRTKIYSYTYIVHIWNILHNIVLSTAGADIADFIQSIL